MKKIESISLQGRHFPLFLKMDIGTTNAAGTTNSPAETMEAFHRPKDC